MGAFSRLSLTAKLAVVIVGANLAGLAVTTWLSWSADLAAGMRRVETEWAQATQQIGATAEGAVKWKKAAVIQEAYKTYRGDPSLGLRYFMAVNGKGDAVDKWVPENVDGAPAEALVMTLIGGKPENPVIDRSLAGEVVAVAPLSLDKKGNRIGYVATAWSTEKVSASSRLQAGLFAGKQALVIAFVIAAFLVAMRQFAGKPLAALGARISQVREGDLDAPVPHSERSDSIGVIARALAGSIQSIRDKAEQEHLARQRELSMEHERGAFAEQMRQSADKQAHTIAILGASLERVAGGDFSARLGEVDPDFEKLRRDFNTMVAAVSETLAGIATTASGLDGGAVDLAGSADQLARRTETQAAALEQTAAALDEITTTVGLSTAKADEASHLVAAAKDSAQGSSAIVRDAISAMDRIQDSSSQIGKIIGVIDEIAFQTNLLALNAGVEAARAGEAGKGFAVVAQEVRELAGRAAGAAKDIKGLIARSSTEVRTGVQLVTATRDQLGHIVTDVSKINELVRAIATAANEQSTGIHEINSAITQMDQMTQKNAAMVEETNAASHTLAQDAGSLTQLMNQFRIGEHGAAVRVVPAAATPASRPKPSPALHLVDKLAGAFQTKKAPAPAAASTNSNNWEEF